ncbi:MAG: hypothetical protein B7X78_02690, partial [Sphingomonadales bacterium 39-62-4]
MTSLTAQAISRAGDAYIGGTWVPSSGSERLPVINPANGALLAEIVAGTSADLDSAVAAARAAFAVSPVAERLAL